MLRSVIGVVDQACRILLQQNVQCHFRSIVFSMFPTGIEFSLPVPDDSVPLSDTKDTSRLVEYSLRCSLDLIVKPTDLYRTF